MDTLEWRGISLPILIRFGEILKHRLGEMHQAFDIVHTRARLSGRLLLRVSHQGESAAAGGGRGFRIRPALHFGLEAGSKPELLAVLAIADNDTPIICNGFKDDEYIEMVMLARKIGRNIIPVVEKFTELELIVKHAEKVGVRPRIGLRVKFASRGSGRWKSSGGYRSKFGLTVSEALQGGRVPEGARAWKTASSCCTSTSAARSRTSARSRPR